MLWRHLCLLRAWSAAGLLTGCSLFLGATTPARAETDGPAPTADAAASETVSVLDARKAGDLAISVRGAGQDRVKMTVKNTTGRRLKVILPPGLVASSAAGQGRGFQSMGLGAVSNKPGSFGAFEASKDAEPQPGFRSVAARGDENDKAIAVPAGQSVELTVVSVCLNFGVRTPNASDRFELVDVDDYTTDVRARKALRSLATYGTSHGVAQAAMWRVCNDVAFGTMAEQATKVMNPHEVALAARFVEALDASASTELVDPAYLTENRLFVRIAGDGAMAKDAARLATEIEGLRLLGLPVHTLVAGDNRTVNAPAADERDPHRQPDRRDERQDSPEPSRRAGPLGVARQDVVPRRLGPLRPRRRRACPRGRSGGVLGVRDGEDRQEDVGPDDDPRREPLAVHALERDAEGRQLAGRSDGLVPRRRDRAGPFGRRARPVRDCHDRPGRVQRPLIEGPQAS